MKFLRLEIFNLASLDGPGGEMIDFVNGPLGAGNIFCIVGPTGSGKSTILDAICLALYGNTPRYTRRKKERKSKFKDYGTETAAGAVIGETDPRNILSRGRKDGYSKLTFIGPDGFTYRSEWSIRFKTRNYDDAHMALFRLSTDSAGQVSEEKMEISAADLLGIDFERFQRTVIIAQGAFAAFLKSDPEERWRLLEGIVGTGQLHKAIGAETNRRYQEATRHLDEINTRIALYKESILTPEELAELDDEIARLSEEDTARRQRIKSLEQAMAWFATYEKLTADITSFEAAKSAAAEARLSLAQQALRLSLRDATAEERQLLRDIRSAEQSIAGYDRDIADAARLIERDKTFLTPAEEALAGLSQASQAAEEEAVNKRPVITQARSVKAEIAAAQALRDSNAAALSKAEKEVKKALKALNDNKAEAEKARKADKDARQAQAAHVDAVNAETARRQGAIDPALLTISKLSAQLAGKNLKELQSDATRTAAFLKALNDIILISDDIARYSKAVTDKEAEIISISDVIKELSDELKTLDPAPLKENIQALESSLTLMTSEDWKLHRHALTEGSPCPLCGALHHPYQAEENYRPALTLLENLAAAKRSELAALESRRQELENSRSTNNGRIEQLGKGVAADRRELARANSRRDELTLLFPALARPVDRLKDMLPGAEEKNLKAIEEVNSFLALDSQLRQAQTKLDSLRDALTAYKATSEAQAAALQAAINKASETLARLEGSTAPLTDNLAAANTTLDKASQALADSDKTIAGLRETLHNLMGDTDPDDLEQTLTRAVTQSNDLVSRKKEEIAAIREAIERNKGIRDNLVKVRTEADTVRLKTVATLECKIQSREIEGKPLTLSRLAQIEDMADDWEAVRAACRTADEALTRATTTLENAVARKQEHDTTRPDDSRENITAEHASLSEISDEPLRAARNKRQAHDEATARAAEVAPELNEARTLALDTKKLNDAVGGAEGLTLRRIAQCYTLRFLIDHANREIRKFNPRYELRQVNRSLAIRVIDHDRGGTIRETTSLSGGETFIVSLGLALGLSALSSCSAASFDNLFIDEGFGSLDAETLATVVESLAGLQSSLGKKVGVISHTDTMTERISTRIRVSPLSGHPGSSTITIEA